MSENMTQNDRSSLIAATQAGNAMVELMRFHAEGPASDRAFGDVEVICLFAEALKLACEIEFEFLEPLRGTHLSIAREIAEIQQLHAAATSYIDGWAG